MRLLPTAALLSGFAATAAAQASPLRNPNAKGDTAAVAKSDRYRSRILGVFDENTGAPIAGAEVFDVASGWSTATTATGTVSLFFLPDGGSVVRIRKVGYAPLLETIAISRADTAPVTLTMTRLTELPAVVTRDTARHFISPGLNGFAERARLRLTGYFITDSILRREEYRTLGNVLRTRLPGAMWVEGAGSSIYLMGTARCSGGGPPEVYLDGTPLNMPGTGDNAGATVKRVLHPYFNLNSLSVSELAGIEFYPSTESLPIEFSHTTTGCGALLLWTRER